MELETGVVANANGSARARRWGADVLVGVKVEVSDATARLGLGLLGCVVVCV
jgi:exosome complex RNA-binding protein Rrp42 (RNase PH superfamily)